MITVAAALIQRQGRILICRRRADQDHPGKWEFPGGKLESGETPETCLRRELAEELGIEAVIGNEITRYRFQYPGRKQLQLVSSRLLNTAVNPTTVTLPKRAGCCSSRCRLSTFWRVTWSL